MFQRFGAPQADATNGPICLASAWGWRWPKPALPTVAQILKGRRETLLHGVHLPHFGKLADLLATQALPTLLQGPSGLVSEPRRKNVVRDV